MALYQAIVGGVAFFAGVTIDERSAVPIGSAVAVGIVVYWTGRKVQHVFDQLKQLKTGQIAIATRIKMLPCCAKLPGLETVLTEEKEEEG